MSQNGLNRVLLFDDDADFRNLLKAYLGKHFKGVELEEYDPVARGVPGEDFDWSRYDVLLLDYYLCLHGVTGLDILQANRKNLLFPATIMLTGAGNEEVAVRALKAGVHDYLRKEKLDKEILCTAIQDAFEHKQSELKKRNELTQQNRAFNKALFYQELEQQKSDAENGNRALLLIGLDNSATIEERAGPILRDNIVRHIARQSYEIFQMGDCNPSITRFSDVSVALLVDDPGSEQTLDFNLQGLCNHLKKRPFKFEDKKFRYTVSIGAVRLDNRFGGAESLVRIARESCEHAAEQDGNSYHILREEPDTSSPADKAPPADPMKAEPAVTVQEIPPSSTEPEDITPVAAEEQEPTTPAESKTGQKPSMGQDLNETELPESELGEQARRIKQAIDEKRIIQTFQSIIPLLSTNENESGDFYYVSLQMLNKDGAINGAGDILAAAADSPALRKHIDRWMLREIIGRIINGTGEHLFLLHISRDSLADPSLFNWLRTLLSGLDQIRPGSRIALEIDAADFAALQKPAGALMTYLQKNQGFRFVLGGIDEYNDAAATASRARFSFMRLNHSLINEATAEEASTVSTKDPNIQIIADNIEDAMSLTAAIAAGAEYAMGPFISEPAEQIDDHTNIESFEIV